MNKFRLYSFRAGGLVTMPIGSKKENKKSKETLVLDCFLSTKTCQTWYSRNKFASRQDCEEPDFIFIDANNQTHGLELVQNETDAWFYAFVHFLYSGKDLIISIFVCFCLKYLSI